MTINFSVSFLYWNRLDLSLIMRWQVGQITTLFTGDLNNTIGTWLVNTKPTELAADILKVPHHGGRGIAPNAFFMAVNPTHLLVPSPAWLWCSERAHLIRGFADNPNIKTGVNGFHGTAVVSFDKDQIAISSENTPTEICAELANN